MPPSHLVFRGQRVITKESVGPASIHVRGGRVIDVSEYDDAPEGWVLCDAGELVLMPGLVASPVHVNGPGRTRWEGFETATRAAARGGSTPMVGMRLNSIRPTTTPAGLQAET